MIGTKTLSLKFGINRLQRVNYNSRNRNICSLNTTAFLTLKSHPYDTQTQTQTQTQRLRNGKYNSSGRGRGRGTNIQYHSYQYTPQCLFHASAKLRNCESDDNDDSESIVAEEEHATQATQARIPRIDVEIETEDSALANTNADIDGVDGVDGVDANIGSAEAGTNTAIDADRTPSLQRSESMNNDSAHKLQSIVDEISHLNLLEVSQLVSLLQQTLNLPSTAMMGSGMGSGMAMPSATQTTTTTDAVEDEEPEREQTIFDVVLKSFPSEKKVATIKEVRVIYKHLGLKEAKALVEKAPVTLQTSVPKVDANEIKEKLESIGAEIVLE